MLAHVREKVGLAREIQGSERLWLNSKLVLKDVPNKPSSNITVEKKR
jgi:hypothetical protein